MVRWRTQAMHHSVQEKGRLNVFLDYHLRVGQVTQDTRLPEGHALREQRLDETEAGTATTVMLLDAKRPAGMSDAAEIVGWFGLLPDASGLVAWDLFDAVLTPDDLLLLVSWRDQATAEAYEASVSLPQGVRLRLIRVVRDYGMYDRRETPQYYPDVARAADA